MVKQKHSTKKKVVATHRHALPSTRQLHMRRAWWFTVLTSGLVLIQFAYNIHNSGQPQVLGYATSISTDALLHSTNDYRTRAGLQPLTLNDNLDRAADAKAANMISQNYWSHISPDGTTPWYFLQRVGYHYDSAGENLAYGFGTSDQVVTAWMNSAEHRANVLGNYSEVGFGYASGDHYQHGKNTVVVAFYGQPAIGAAKNTGPSNPVTTVAATPQHISGISTILSGNAPWATYASLALIGATMLGFLVTHLDTLRLGWHTARKYILLHPAIDAAVLLVLAIIFVQAAGGFIR